MYENVKKYFSQFANLNQEEWLSFESILKIEKVKKKTPLVEFGTVCRKIYFVEKGSVRLYYYKEGEEVCGKFFFENELTASFESFIQQKPSFQILETLEDSVLISFLYDDLQKLYDKYPVYYKVFMNILNYSFILIQKLISLYILTDPLERYLQLVEQYPEIIQRVPQKYIASFLGITPFSLSRIKARLANK